MTFPTTFDENEQPQYHPGAIAQRISADGDIYGCLHGHDLGPSMHGAAWTRTGTRSLLPNGGQVDDTMGVPMSMNNGGTPGGGRTIVGFFVDMENRQHGYLVKDGMLAAYDPDGADLTAIWDINSSGQFVGVFRYPTDLATKRHGFLKDPDTWPRFSSISRARNSRAVPARRCTPSRSRRLLSASTRAGSLSASTSIVSGGPAHGFVAFPAGRRPDNGTGLNLDQTLGRHAAGSEDPSNVITRPQGERLLQLAIDQRNPSFHSSSSQPRSACGRGATR